MPLPASTAVCSCNPARPWRLLYAGRRAGGRPRPVRVRAEDPQSPEPYEKGDSKLQEALVNQLKFEIGKKQVDAFVEEESEKLRMIAEEQKEELEKIAELTEMKANLAFDSALADINKTADEFEEELKRNRERLLEEERELAQWEQDVAVSRSQGQFFQSLYQADKKRPVGEDAQQLKERAAERVVEPARQELGSVARMYTFAIAASVLLASVVVDVQSDSLSPGQDILYTILAALLAWSSWSERRAL